MRTEVHTLLDQPIRERGPTLADIEKDDIFTMGKSPDDPAPIECQAITIHKNQVEFLVLNGAWHGLLTEDPDDGSLALTVIDHPMGDATEHPCYLLGIGTK